MDVQVSIRDIWSPDRPPDIKPPFKDFGQKQNRILAKIYWLLKDIKA